MRKFDIKSFSVPELLTLRDEIDQHLLAHRDELQAQLAKIGRMSGRIGPARGIKVAPKYRHPQTGETWSGRGGLAGWLVREINAGRRREDFLIDTRRDGSKDAVQNEAASESAKPS